MTSTGRVGAGSWKAVSVALGLLPLLASCGGRDEGAASWNGRSSGTLDARRLGFVGPVLTTQPVSLEPGGERLSLCQSFPLRNEDWLFVSGVRLSAAGVHHSNWLAVPEDAYPGPSGSADCEAFGFGSFFSDVPTSGGLLFSQSSQSTDETQVMGHGAAFVVAPHSQIFVSYHALNLSADTAHVGITAALQLLHESDVRVRLTTSGGHLGLLALPPLSRSRFSTDCVFPTSPRFSSYFMLPHYHFYGTGMTLELIGGTRDGEVVWENEGAIGEGLGARIEPAVDFTGAAGFRFSCAYDNPTGATILGGATGNEEMCSFAMSTDSAREFAAMAGPGFGAPKRVDHGINGAGEHLFSIDGCLFLER